MRLSDSVMRLILTFVTTILLVLPAAAQLDRGAITGTITDASGAAVPDAKITVRSSGTNARQQTDSTVSGQYTAPNLPSAPTKLPSKLGALSASSTPTSTFAPRRWCASMRGSISGKSPKPSR